MNRVALDVVRAASPPRPRDVAKAISVRIVPRAYWGILYIAAVPGAAATGVGLHASPGLAVAAWLVLAAALFVYTIPRRRRGDAFGRDAQLATGTIQPFTLDDQSGGNATTYSKRTGITVIVEHASQRYAFYAIVSSTFCTFAAGDELSLLFDPAWDVALIYASHEYPSLASRQPLSASTE